MSRAAPARRPLGELDSRAAARLLGAGGDIALVLDGAGKILEMTVHDAELAKVVGGQWRGKAWIDTVTVESRDKIASLLRDADVDATPRWRQVNHPARRGDDLPVLYSAVRVADDGRTPATGRIVAFGRDLRPTVQLQKRLVEAQQAMERDYWRFREAETRYRNLFQTASEAVLIVDASTLRIVEANPAAETLWARTRTRLVGASVTGLFDPVGAEGVQSLLAATRMVGPREPVRAALADGRTHVAVSASAFRQDAASFLLVRATPWRVETPAAAAPVRVGRRGAAAPSGVPVLEAWADHLPDAHAFTDAQGRIVAVNRAFAALAQLSTAEQARGRMLDQWVGSTGVELSVLLGNLRQHGSMGLFVTTLRGEFGASAEIEIAAAPLPAESGAALVFALRDVGRRAAAPERGAPRLPRSPHEMTELVGRVPLKQIVSETTDLIEQLCIETALQMTGDNRASAAQLLGLSRQSLYVKLRRFGLGETGVDEGSGGV